jgi:hypothetical protein
MQAEFRVPSACERWRRRTSREPLCPDGYGESAHNWAAISETAVSFGCSTAAVTVAAMADLPLFLMLATV